mgnify:CR=1 FL=1
MKMFSRLMLIGFLGLFVVGTVADTTNATAMSLKMALADSNDMGMGECNDCDGENGIKSSCDLVCVAPLLAHFAEGAIFLPPHASLTVTIDIVVFTGRTGPPDHNPPRTLILS